MVSENMAIGSPNLHLPVSVLQELMISEKGRSMTKKSIYTEGVLDFNNFMNILLKLFEILFDSGKVYSIFIPWSQ